MKKIIFTGFFLTIIMHFGACVSKKDIIYFQNDQIDQAEVSNSYKAIFKPDDLLNISISSIDTEAVKPFNLSIGAEDAATGQSYLVDSNGYIDFPVLGKLKIGGLQRFEVIDLLKNKLDPDYIKNPNINIKIANFKISILGDVKTPGSYTVPNERITILEAIALAGDLNISAQRDNILIHREESGKKVEYKVNLLSKKIYTSPVYYLQQNDVIYVKQNYASIQSASRNSNTTLFISITSLLVVIISQLF